jgi:hypothetical protein
MIWQLTKLINPGPFTSKNLKLDQCPGIFDAGRSIAIAGSRICVDDYA